MIQTPEEVLQIRVEHVAHGRCTREDFSQRRQRVMCAKPRPTAKRTGQKVLLINRTQNAGHTALQCPIGYTRNAQRPLLFLAGFRYEHPQNRRRSVSLVMDRTEHLRRPLLEALLRVLRSEEHTSELQSL